MNDIVNVQLLGFTQKTIPVEEAKALDMDIDPAVDDVQAYTFEYAVYDEGKYDDGLRVEVQAYWDEIGGYYLHDMTVHGDFDPGDDQLVKELIDGIFIREYDHEIWCELPITMSLDTMQHVS